MAHLEESPAWQALAQHQREVAGVHMRDLFARDPQRFARFSLQFGDILFDFSKNRITEQTLPLLFDLARQAGLAQMIEAMFSGQKINITEDRAVLHVALRNRSNDPDLCGWAGRDARGQPGAGQDAQLQRGRALGRMEGLHRQGHHRRRQYRHRRLGPGPQDGLRGAEALCQARPARPFCLQRGQHRPGGDAQDAQPGNHPVPGGLQDLHHPGDDDQRPFGAPVVPGSGQRRSRRRQAFRRHVHQHRGGAASSASIPATCSSSGIGSAGAIRCGRPSGCPSPCTWAWTVSKSC